MLPCGFLLGFPWIPGGFLYRFLVLPCGPPYVFFMGSLFLPLWLPYGLLAPPIFVFMDFLLLPLWLPYAHKGIMGEHLGTMDKQ